MIILAAGLLVGLTLLTKSCWVDTVGRISMPLSDELTKTVQRALPPDVSSGRLRAVWLEIGRATGAIGPNGSPGHDQAVGLRCQTVDQVRKKLMTARNHSRHKRLEITRPMGNVLTVLLFVLPLSVDTFAIAAAVGANQLSGWGRWRISTIFAVFEGGTPLVGLGLGSSVGQVVGGVAEYLSGVLLILLGGYLWWSSKDDEGDNDDEEAAKAQRLLDARGLTLVGLALSISLDELAIGFSFGIGANFTVPTTIIAVIALQALAVSQLGLSFGAWISQRMRERIQRTAGPVLILLGFYPLIEALIRLEWASSSGAAIAGTLVIILAAAIVYLRLVAPPQTASVVTQLRTVPSARTNQRSDS